MNVFVSTECKHSKEQLEMYKGSVAFVNSKDVHKFFERQSNGVKAENYKLLCRQGTRSLDQEAACHWGVIPGDVYVASRASGRSYLPAVYGAYLARLFYHTKTSMYPEEVRYVTRFNFPALRIKNIKREISKLVKNLIADFRVVAELKRLDIQYSGGQPTSTEYLRQEGGDHFRSAMLNEFPACRTKDTMRLCVTSTEEMEKCQWIQNAIRAAALPQSLECKLAWSSENCVRLLNSSQADVHVMEAHKSDEYAHEQKVRPLLREDYGNNEPVYAVAVALSTSRAQKLKDLQSGQLNVCSAGTDSFAGWEAPNHALKSIGIIDKDVCKLNEAWARIFRTSCVPGARNASVTWGRSAKSRINPDDVTGLCRGCGSGAGNCLTPAEAGDMSHLDFETYYGDIGALRCLVRRKADVAFVKSSAIQTLLTLKARDDQDFARLELSDFAVLCQDGKTKKSLKGRTLTDNLQVVQECNLGKLPDKWMVSRNNADSKQVLRWQDLWVLASYRARKYFDWFHTYVHVTPGRTDHLLDLIFTNSTVQFKRFPTGIISEEEFHDVAYGDWLSPFDCSAAASVYIANKQIAFSMLSTFAGLYWIRQLF